MSWIYLTLFLFYANQPAIRCDLKTTQIRIGDMTWILYLKYLYVENCGRIACSIVVQGRSCVLKQRYTNAGSIEYYKTFEICRINRKFASCDTNFNIIYNRFDCEHNIGFAIGKRRNKVNYYGYPGKKKLHKFRTKRGQYFYIQIALCTFSYGGLCEPLLSIVDVFDPLKFDSNFLIYYANSTYKSKTRIDIKTMYSCEGQRYSSHCWYSCDFPTLSTCKCEPTYALPVNCTIKCNPNVFAFNMTYVYSAYNFSQVLLYCGIINFCYQKVVPPPKQCIVTGNETGVIDIFHFNYNAERVNKTLFVGDNEVSLDTSQTTTPGLSEQIMIKMFNNSDAVKRGMISVVNHGNRMTYEVLDKVIDEFTTASFEFSLKPGYQWFNRSKRFKILKRVTEIKLKSLTRNIYLDNDIEPNEEIQCEGNGKPAYRIIQFYRTSGFQKFQDPTKIIQKLPPFLYGVIKIQCNFHLITMDYGVIKVNRTWVFSKEHDFNLTMKIGHYNLTTISSCIKGQDIVTTIDISQIHKGRHYYIKFILDKSSTAIVDRVVVEKEQNKWTITLNCFAGLVDKYRIVNFEISERFVKDPHRKFKNIKALIQPTHIQLTSATRRAPVTTDIYSGEQIVCSSNGRPHYRVIFHYTIRGMQIADRFNPTINIGRNLAPTIVTLRCTFELISYDWGVMKSTRVWTLNLKKLVILYWNTKEKFLSEGFVLECKVKKPSVCPTFVTQLEGPTILPVRSGPFKLPIMIPGYYTLKCTCPDDTALFNFTVLNTINEICLLLFAPVPGALVECGHTLLPSELYKVEVTYSVIFKNNEMTQYTRKDYYRIPYYPATSRFKTTCKVTLKKDGRASLLKDLVQINTLEDASINVYFFSKTSQLCELYRKRVDKINVSYVDEYHRIIRSPVFHLQFYVRELEYFFRYMFPLCLFMVFFLYFTLSTYIEWTPTDYSNYLKYSLVTISRRAIHEKLLNYSSDILDLYASKHVKDFCHCIWCRLDQCCECCSCCPCYRHGRCCNIV